MRTDYPIFLSVVCHLRNQNDLIEPILQQITEVVRPLVYEYEIVIVDNGSTDASIETMKHLTGDDGLPNIQVFSLINEVDSDTASYVALEHALGDYVVMFNPLTDSIDVLPDLLRIAMQGYDAVFAKNELESEQNRTYRIANSAFNAVYSRIGGVHLANDAPQYRILSRLVANSVLKQNQPAVAYRHFPASGGFSKTTFKYESQPVASTDKGLGESINRGLRMLVSTSQLPLRLVTGLALFGAASNVLYSVYVVLVAALKSSVAPGWVSLSLQQSGMFFLISLVLLVIGEYIVNMSAVTTKGTDFLIGREMKSSKLTKLEKLNVDRVVAESA